MFKNYLKIAWRNIKRHKAYSFINISGLAIGMAVCILIIIWVQDELSYDRFHENGDRIYRLTMDIQAGTALHTPLCLTPAAPALSRDFPEIINAVRISRPGRVAVKHKDKVFQEEMVGFAENSIFDIFTFPLVSGDPKSALETAHSVVITESMAKKYFGSEDPLGKILRIGNDQDYAVTGVVKDIPWNSHFTFNMLRSFETLYKEKSVNDDRWFDVRFYGYLLLGEQTDAGELDQKLPAFVDKHIGQQLKAMGGSLKFFLQPLTRIHLYSDFERDISANGDIAYVILFSGIALFVLIIAGINFINLSTARSATRAQEVGMRKTLGAVRSRLVGQFLGESLIYSFLAMILAVVLLILSLPLFNALIGRELSANLIQAPWLIAAFMGLAAITGIFAGSYPAFFLSSFQPVSVLKGLLKVGASNSRFRKTLVVFQFAISVALIIGTLTVYKQIVFMKNRKLGFDKEYIVVIPGMNDSMRKSYRSIRNELMNLPGVIDVGASDIVPSRGRLVAPFLPEGFAENQVQTMDYLDVDAHYIPAMGMEIAAGRNFSEDFATDPDESVVINETAAKKFGWEKPIGKKFVFRTGEGSDRETIKMSVIGVVKDFHMRSLREKIEPLIIFYDYSSLRSFSIRIASDNIVRTMDLLEKKWKEFEPSRPFNYLFLDDAFDSQYRSEERLRNITLYFSLLAIFIGCLGLFGMASFTAEQRTKEIGIRKVLGASVSGIVSLLAREFLLLVAIANLIAWPVAYYGMNRWLENFAYRTNVGWETPVLAGILALAIALITVSYQAIRAALTDPVDALRYE